jgi:hypothetical protein
MAGVIVGAKLIGGESWERKLRTAFETWASEDIDDAYWDDQFKSDRWLYPNETRRKNGEVVTSPRDIYDLGELYDSGRESFKITQGAADVTATWNWDAKNSSGRAYAWYVHEGLGTNITPRRWTDELQDSNRFEASSVRLALKRRIKIAFQGK